MKRALNKNRWLAYTRSDLMMTLEGQAAASTANDMNKQIELAAWSDGAGGRDKV
jgi:hypothetical protein